MASKGFRGVLKAAISGVRRQQVYPLSTQIRAAPSLAGLDFISRRHSSGGTLVRDFIHDSLYNPGYGYFAAASSVVGTLKEPINFPSLRGKTEYQKLLRKAYEELDVSWLTPVETFQPWYSHAIAEYILRQHLSRRSSEPLQIYELGGGSGTNAVSILNYVKDQYPKAYRTVKYTCVEISKELASRQLARVRQVHSHKGKFSVELRDAVERPGWGEREETSCFVVMLEVLDNLPHDRVQRAGEDFPWMETHVYPLPEESRERLTPAEAGSQPESVRTAEWEEGLVPIKDRYVSACLDAAIVVGPRNPFPWWPKEWTFQMPAPDVMWLPTTCYKLLETLHDARPKMTLIAADFDTLPEVQIQGARAPLVASQHGGETTDHPTYLIPKGTADIFFPTDFRLLKQIDEICADNSANTAGASPSVGRKSAIVSTAEFMEKFATAFLPQTLTKSGYNPLVEDYTNASFYLSVPIQSFPEKSVEKDGKSAR